MKKAMVATAWAILLLSACIAYAAPPYVIGGKWFTEGGGFAEKGVLRVSLKAWGEMNVISTVNGDSEEITGYDVWSELEASLLGISAWSYRETVTLPAPIAVDSFNPSMSEPYQLPSFTANGLTYTVTLTSVTSGTVEVRGDVDIDSVGTCRISANCELWKEGTERPNISDSDSGCNAGFGVLSLLFASAVLKRRGVKK